MSNVGKFGEQKMKTNFFGKANFKDMTHREDVLHNRMINKRLGISSAGLLIFTVLAFRFTGFGELIIWTGIIGCLLLFVSLFRLGFVRTSKRKKVRDGGWEKIDRLPGWAYKKMKKQKNNIVNGEHYRYKKDGKRFYRKRK